MKKGEQLTPGKLSAIEKTTIEKLDVHQARKEVEPFVKDPEMLTVWSQEFFHDVMSRIVLV